MKFNPNIHPVDAVLNFLPQPGEYSPGSEYTFVICALQLLRDSDPRLWRPGFGDNPLIDIYDRLNAAGIEDEADGFIKIRDQLANLFSKWSDLRRPGPAKDYTRVTPSGGPKCLPQQNHCAFEYRFDVMPSVPQAITPGDTSTLGLPFC